MKLPGINRIFPLILTILLLPSLLAVPARADDFESDFWIQLLDYGYSHNGTNHVSWTPSSSRVTLELDYSNPIGVKVESFDILIYTDDPSPQLATPYVVDPIDLGDGYFRFFGSGVRDETGRNGFLMKFYVDEGSYLEVVSAKVSSKNFARYSKPYSGYVYDFSYDPVLERFFSGYGNTPMDAISISPNAPSSDLMAGHVARVDIAQWQSMDYITLNIATWSTIVSSLKVEISGFPVPYSINTVESANIQGVSLYLIDITIDLTGIDRTLSSPISVDLSGQVKLPYHGSFAVQSCLGLVSIDSPSTDTFWFTKLINSVTSGFSSIGTWISEQTSSLVYWLSENNISLAIGFDGVSTWLSYVHNAIGTGFSNVFTWITNQTLSITTSISTWGQNIVNAINPPADTDDMRNEVENIRDQMQDANDVMNELQRPDIDDLFHEVQLDIGSGSPFADIMSGLFANDFIVTIVTGSLAFTLFGILVG